VADLGRLAKETLCRVDGVGVDLIPTLFAAHGGQLIGTATVLEDPEATAESQFTRASEAAALMRVGWSADAMCLLTEAFVGVGPAQELDNLAVAFAAGNPDVHECLFLIASTVDEVVACALPYRYALGRTIDWDPPLGETALPGAVGPYITMFQNIFAADPVPPPADWAAAVEAIAECVREVGFAVETFVGDDVYLAGG
jgi:hypothetical protein